MGKTALFEHHDCERALFIINREKIFILLSKATYYIHLFLTTKNKACIANRTKIPIMLFLKRHKNISNILNSRFEIEEKEALTQITLHKKTNNSKYNGAASRRSK